MHCMFTMYDTLASTNGNLQSFMADVPQARALLTLAPDLLHQLIKGVFKDHLVQWVEEYLILVHGKKRAEEILDDIDCR
jgi:Plavaka transposase